MELIQQPFHLWESVLFDILRTLPHMILVLYAFRDHWRYNKSATFLLTSTLWVIEMLLSEIGTFVQGGNGLFISILEIIIYIVFIFLVLKEHIGKLVFTVLSLRNMGNIMLFGGKCLEGLFFPELALLRYHFTYALFSLPVLALELLCAYHLIFKDICTHNASLGSSEETEKSAGTSGGISGLFQRCFL